MEVRVKDLKRVLDMCTDEDIVDFSVWVNRSGKSKVNKTMIPLFVEVESDINCQSTDEDVTKMIVHIDLVFDEEPQK